MPKSILRFAVSALLPVLLMARISSGLEILTYEREVRPILKAHCFQCHGEDGKKEGQLDLRLKRTMVAGGESGAAISPGKIEQSLLLERIEAGEMPPEDKHLSSQDIATIRNWISAGAITARAEPEKFDESEYLTEEERNFWSFQPIVRPQLPSVNWQEINSTQLPTSPIDYFVLSRLQKQGFQFSDRAARATMVRRLYFDLTGLPPSPQAATDFINDDSPGSYERLVDQLLASPRYGERWGRHWLDVVGYADSEGYVDSDPVRNWSYLYRDYVIRAFNDNMPFDQFVIEQMAGDELAEQPFRNMNETQIRLLAATGFLRMAPDGTGNGGIDQNVAKNEVVADTLNIMTTSLLGLTVGCARCHNHRYDPISQKDYYRLRAIFEPALDWKGWRVPNARRISLYRDEDRAMAATVEEKAKLAEAERTKVQAAHIERTLYEELIKAPDNLKEKLQAAFKAAKDKRTPEQVALLKEYPNIQNISNGSLYLYSQQRGRRSNEIAAVANKKEKAAIERVKNEGLEELSPEDRAAIQAILAVATEKRTPEQLAELAKQPAATVAAKTLKDFAPEEAKLIAEYRAAAEKCRQTDAKKQLDDMQSAIVNIRATAPKERFIRALAEPHNHLPKTFLFRRGNHGQPAGEVTPAELNVLKSAAPTTLPENDPSLPTTGRRLAYARHLTNGQHPLLARVIVNRIWLHHFGRGIVNTPGDFGLLGERPSHPLLLDWLATEFMNSDWDVKHVHRLILSSTTYRQASTRTEQLDTVDPDNKFYGRQSIRRLESEVFRDAVIAASGLANDRMYGTPLPVKEDGVGQIVLGIEALDGERKPTGNSDLNGAQHRRSVYVQVRRSRPLAVLEAFDIATVAPNCTKRSSSNVAPQALLMMNSQFMVDYSTAFADRVRREAGDELSQQLKLAWKIAYANEISDESRTAMLEFVETQAGLLREDDAKLSEVDSRKKALAVACQALLGANQFLYVD
jgi:cytochrome c553